MPTITIFAFLVFIILSLIPLRKEKNRNTWGYISAFGSTIVAIVIFLAVLLLNVNLLLGIGIMVVMSILLDRNTYTKAGIITLGILAIIMGGLAYYVLREDVDFVVNYIKTDSTTSFYYAVNDEVVVSRNEDMNIPLASTAKMTIAGVFAEEVVSGNIDPDEQIDIVDLEKFYLPDSDGGAHLAWLKDVGEETVSLEEVVRGMISFSSNANTDYLLERLGIQHVNERIAEWGLGNHDNLIPFVSGLIVIQEYDRDLEDLPFEDYEQQVLETHQSIVNGQLDASEMNLTAGLGDQRFWSDWLPSSTTAEYSRWLNQVQTGEWADEEASDYFMSILTDIYDAPEGYTMMGGKGGSTAFVLNEPRFLTTVDGDFVQWAMFTDNLNAWERFKLNRNYFTFVQQFLENREYREDVVEELQSAE
ncbi:serine hydrolase [Geomicrobium sp. JCM 19038]|uniref:serine hydrolase n=1 Tax=Geomicrobium sp. JCM 19038 TaxID=1460635 RepID=UPI00045F2F73|nr:serine hydrolase [Geomicrobium sp. JCM 19038]GAK08443.1 possible D-alanyl-D-alanine carboxypeptidase [Geomicrobium sp. JCM 19038]